MKCAVKLHSVIDCPMHVLRFACHAPACDRCHRTHYVSQLSVRASGRRVKFIVLEQSETKFHQTSTDDAADKLV